MSQAVAPPGWYADPAGGSGQRYWDGAQWTGYAVPWPGAAPSVFSAPASPWKGARYGRPAAGPGSLAEPARRLGARLLDGLVFAPVVIVSVAIAIVIVATHAGPMFPKATSPNTNPPTPGFVWLYLAMFGVAIVDGVLFCSYEAVATAKFGRTLGKRWMRLRPVTLDGQPLGWGRSFGRAALQFVGGWFGWVGLLDDLWCVWDGDSQCVHDKIVGTLVVND